MDAAMQWQMIQSHVSSTQHTQENTLAVEVHLENIRNSLEVKAVCCGIASMCVQNENNNPECAVARTESLESLSVALRTQTMR